MIRFLSFCPLLLSLLSPVMAQDVRTVSARVVYFQESNDDPAEVFCKGPGGEPVKVTPAAGVSGESVKVAVDGSGQVVMQKTPASGPTVAIAKVPAGVGEAVFFLLKNPAAGAQGPLYQALVADESMKVLPRGGAYVCNISAVNTRIALGETKYALPPGKPAHIKRPDKRDAYNMAAVQVEFQEGEEWKPIKDTMIRFSENERYFILVSAEAKAAPSVKIYKQIVPQAAPAP